MYSFILVVHIILAILIIALVLVQQGKGAEAGASFGGGGAATVFGASGAGNFLTRLTAIFTALFFVTSLTLAVFAKNKRQMHIRLNQFKRRQQLLPHRLKLHQTRQKQLNKLI